MAIQYFPVLDGTGLDGRSDDIANMKRKSYRVILDMLYWIQKRYIGQYTFLHPM